MHEREQQQKQRQYSVASPSGFARAGAVGRFAAGLDAGLKPTSNPKGISKGKSQMRGFFAALRMTSKRKCEDEVINDAYS